MLYKSVGIIGAGIAGLVCADRLRRGGVSVRVFEKSRGVGGRSATRHLQESSCDHGAQYFTVTDPVFAQRVTEWQDAGVVDVWHGRIVVIEEGAVRPLNEPRERFVGTPGMNSIGKHLAQDLNVSRETQIAAIEPHNDGWTLRDSAGRTHGPFEALIFTAPPQQTSALLADHSPLLSEQLHRVEMLPCWSVMLTFTGGLPVDFDGAFVNGSPLSWIARDNSKPLRKPTECWLLHASPEWSLSQLERPAAEVEVSLISEFRKLVGKDIPRPTSVVSHRWRYARPLEPLPPRFLFDSEHRLGTAGDWCGGPRIEGAFLSGHALALHLLQV